MNPFENELPRNKRLALYMGHAYKKTDISHEYFSFEASIPPARTFFIGRISTEGIEA